MESLIKTYTYPNGDIQRVQLLRWEDWSRLEFLTMPASDTSLDCFSAIYRNFLVPAAPWLFGNMILFRLPGDVETELPSDTRQYGTVADRLTAAAAAIREGVKIVRGKATFRNERVRRFWEELERRDCIRIVSGKLPVTTVIPLTDRPGVLSETAPDALMKVNASFFIMDRFDCATVYDQVGTPFGLCVRNGMVTNPPLYHREALLVKRDGSVSVVPMDISMLDIQIGGTVYTPGKNAALYTRPHAVRTPPGRTALVIIGNRVAAVRRGSVCVPASGFVLCPKEACSVSAGDTVTYRGLEDVVFGIQVGNSILRDGEKTLRFRSRFYNIRHLEPVPYPPSLYPMDFDHARAARIALGADASGKPMLLWAEGAAKFGYVPGKGSCGASLKEMADICADLGMHNAVNLDGGGSAQILVNNRRSLMISDRKAENHSEAERPVPLALYIPAE
jgi:hypothetical protein